MGGALKFNSTFGFHILITNITAGYHQFSSLTGFLFLELKKQLIFINDIFEAIFL